MIKLLLIATFMLFGCSPKAEIQNNTVTEKPTVQEKIEKDVIEFNTNKENNDVKTKEYSKEEKIGQLLCIGIEETQLTDNLKSMIDKYRPGAFILFNRNIQNADQLKALNKSIKDYYKEKDYIYPFIFVDQEGGMVDRLKNVYGVMNSANWYYNNSDAKTYAKDLIDRMDAFYFDSPLCPVLDVNDPQSKGAIGNRSFSNDYEKVSIFANQLLPEFKNANILSVAKHFPGHGATTIDSHYDLPIINKSYEELRQTDMKPFMDNIENLDAIMIAHILIPEFDDMPASLSQKWMKELRANNFKGLILSDDLTMDALNNYGDIKDRFIKFINAGGDIGLLCHRNENVEGIFNELKSFDINRIDESFERIMTFKNEKIKTKWFFEGTHKFKFE